MIFILCRFAHTLEDRSVGLFPSIDNAGHLEAGVPYDGTLGAKHSKQLLTGISAWDSAR